MSKPLVGHHLMRVRISKTIFNRLQEVADEECVKTGEHVTVSDLVRAACYNFLLLHESVRQLEAAMLQDVEDDEDEEEDIYYIKRPTL
jgi:hypothetical protein